MISGGRYPSEDMESKNAHSKSGMWIIIIMIVFGLTCPPVLIMAAPVGFRVFEFVEIEKVLPRSLFRKKDPKCLKNVKYHHGPLQSRANLK
jgi:hypothetical protein